MINKLKISISILLSLFIMSCDNNENELYSIDFLQDPLTVEAAVRSYDCGLVTNGDWNAVSSDSWISITSKNGCKDDKLTIRTSTNNINEERIGYILVSSGSTQKKLTVIQKSKIIPVADISLLSFSEDKETKEININTDKEWQVKEVSGDWFEYVIENKKVLVTTNPNFTGSSRSGSLTIACNGNNEKIVVNQSFSNDKFLASTPFGRQLVYNLNGYIKSVVSDSYEILNNDVAKFMMTCTYKDDFAQDLSVLQRKIYLFEVNITDNTTIQITVPNNDLELFKENITTQIIPQQLSSLQQSITTTHKVIGGTNGGFFNSLETPYVIYGTFYKNGICYYNPVPDDANSIFAIMKNGLARCMTKQEYLQEKDNILEGLGGGRQVLVQNGNKVNFTDTRLEPRTAIGVSEDGKKVYLMIIDGREDTYPGTGSHGASYEAMAKIFMSLGAYDAINLDGGGSSTFSTQDQYGNFILHNKPGNLNHALRPVANGLAIIQKK